MLSDGRFYKVLVIVKAILCYLAIMEFPWLRVEYFIVREQCISI
jgi:hypothetical protein